jgi:hypothetical protein
LHKKKIQSPVQKCFRWPSSEPNESSQGHHILFLYDLFKYYHSIHPKSPDGLFFSLAIFMLVALTMLYTLHAPIILLNLNN